MSAAEPAPLKARDGEPVFQEPWQAQVVAIAAELVARGRFTAAAWSETLGEEIRQATAQGRPDTAETYYQAALQALERLVTVNALASPAQLLARKEAWIRAYLHTPHGQPVELSAIS